MARFDVSGDATEHVWAIALMYGSLVLAILALPAMAQSITWFRAFTIAAIAAGLGAGVHHLVRRGFSGLAGSGTTGIARAEPLLSKARTLIQRGDWEGAKVELESQWSAFPGHLDVVREFERLYLDGFRAPAAGGAWLAGALAAVKGADRAYVYLRLAEVYADSDARDPVKAASWCKRLLAEFPAAREASTARAILDQIKPGA